MELEYLKVSYFRSEKFSREFIFAKKDNIREIREIFFPRNFQKTHHSRKFVPAKCRENNYLIGEKKVG